LAYAAVDMFSALVAHILVVKLLLESIRYPTPDCANIEDAVSDVTAFLILAGFGIAGAFVGFMAGRIIGRASA
jgi:hypothetical protein